MDRHFSVKLIGILMLTAVLASACTQVYSQAPLGTPTLIPTGLFVSPFPSGQDPLKIVAQLGTQTAMARTAQAGGFATSALTQTPAAITSTPGGPTATTGSLVTSAVTTPAPVTVNPVTSTPMPQVTSAVPTIAMTRPSTYTLQQGEFPYCIARRFNVDPNDLLSINNINPDNASLFQPGLTLTIPQTGSFPGDRALHDHPDTYTVDSPDTTIYGVACYYGDVLPQNIANANGLSLSATLTVGQHLTIP